MNILIAYATTEGQTRKICRFCADLLIEAGHSVELLQVSGRARDLDPERHDASILAASVHLGRFQKEMVKFAKQHGAALSAHSSLFLSVSLAAAGDDAQDRDDLERIVATFCDDTGYRPGQVEQVAGAFRFTEYDFFRAWAMRYIAAVKGETVDPHGDTEYTDWDGLRRVVTAWIGAATPQSGSRKT